MKTQRASVIAIAALAIVVASACQRTTAPTPDLRPVIDSISPSSDPNIFGRLVCVYGKNLRGGTIYYANTPIPHLSPDDCPILFAYPNGEPGIYPVIVVTDAGFSNVTYFVRR